ncbi:MAG: ABC transporter permease [Acidobacteriaceae bacterium]
MARFAQDLRYALRQLRKAPGFAAVAILTLAIGIGATTAIFTLVYDVLLKPLPYRQPGRLVAMQEVVAEFRDIYPTLPLSANHFTFWEQHSHSFAAMAAMEPGTLPLGTGGHPLQVSVLRSTSGIFHVLDESPELGRGFATQEDQPGHERVVVLMHDLWQQQFHGDRNILGKTVTLDGYPYTIIGVMGASFHLPSSQVMTSLVTAGNSKPMEAILPLAFTKDQLQESAGDLNYFGLARLKPGVSAAQANAEIDAFQKTISASLPADVKQTLSAVLVPLQQFLVGNDRKPLGILLASVSGLLLIGCINITNLLLARAVGRRQEMAIASAMGASRADMARSAMREAMVLAFLGGALGVFLAAIAVPILQHFLPPALNFRGNLHVDWVGSGCAILLAVAATLLAGAAPAWMSWHTQPQEALRCESRSASETRGGKRLRKFLVATEVAVSVALVLTTGLLSTSMYRLLHVHRGFETERILTARVVLPNKEYPSYPFSAASAEFYKKMLFRLQSLPGVERVALTSQVPLGGDRWIDMMRLPGDTRPIFQMPSEHFRWISPGYFQAIHLPLVAGRFLSDSDDGKNYAVISELTAKTLWPGKNSIGQQFTRAGNTGERPFTVIGVVGNARTISLAKPDPLMVYMPYWYRSDSSAGLVVRTRQDPSEMASAIRKAIWSVDPAVAVPTVRSLGGVVADSVASRRFEMDLLLLFAVSALLLAGLGVYGVVTYSVTQRRQEIGLRIALGAQRINIYAQVLREGLTPVFIGTIAGVLMAYGFARLVASLLFEVSAYNPVIAIAAVTTLLLVGAMACLLPAHRAAAVDPIVALRNE